MANDNMSSGEMRQRMTWGVGITLAVAVGVSLGVAMDNMWLGIVIGLAVGVAFYAAMGLWRRPKGPGHLGETDAAPRKAADDAEE